MRDKVRWTGSRILPFISNKVSQRPRVVLPIVENAGAYQQGPDEAPALEGTQAVCSCRPVIAKVEGQDRRDAAAATVEDSSRFVSDQLTSAQKAGFGSVVR
jgi:hypothetical protein